MAQEKTEKWIEYATQIKAQVDEMLRGDDECTNSIDLQELGENNNAAHFLHAFTAVAAMYHERFTQKQTDYLGFNHIANRLCIQFMQRD